MASNGYTETLVADNQTTWQSFVGPIVLKLTGTSFGGGTAKLQERDIQGSTVDVASGSFTAATHTIVDYPAGSINELRVDLSGSTAPSLPVTIQGKRV
jgi:hypothetical protein